MKRTLVIAAAVAVMSSMASAQPLATANSDIGKVLVSAKSGLTLYTFRNDAANLSKCYGGCAEAWPPFVAEASARADGALGIIARRDGTRQWTLNGKPLYFWQGDSRTGDVTGDGVGGVWDAVRN